MLERISRELTTTIGNGFGKPNLRNCRMFYRTYPTEEEIRYALCIKLSWPIFGRTAMPLCKISQSYQNATCQTVGNPFMFAKCVGCDSFVFAKCVEFILFVFAKCGRIVKFVFEKCGGIFRILIYNYVSCKWLALYQKLVFPFHAHHDVESVYPPAIRMLVKDSGGIRQSRPKEEPLRDFPASV